MCLIIETNQKAKVAKEDIVCFKVAIELEGGTLISPYAEHEFELYQMYESDLEIDSFNKHQVLKGFHSFSNLYDAVVEAETWIDALESDSNKVYIFKCIIPKGSKYYPGTFIITVDMLNENKRIKYSTMLDCLRQSKSYASKRIKYLEKITF